MLAGWILLPALGVILLAALGLSLLAGHPDAAPVASADSPGLAAPPPTAVPPTLTTADPPTAVEPSATPLVDATALAVLGQLPATVPWPSDTPTPDIPPTETPAPTDTPSPTPEPVDPITGLPADPAILTRVPLTIMVDNHPDAAPQTGLNGASMVIEALAEGGITRFEAVFTSQSPGTVGPVRSARPYFVEWARPFHAMIVHCGGSWEALDLIKEWGMLTNVDCFDGNMPFWRSSDRVLPHNLYTSTDSLWKLAERKGLAAPDTIPRLPHTAEVPWDARPAGGSVSFTFSTLSPSNVEWIYDRDTNSYRRKQWGYWHRDYESGEIVTAKNVAIIFTNVFDLEDDYEGRLGTDTIGYNTALIASNGRFEWGYWTRETIDSPLIFLDGKEQPLRFAPGNLWVEALGIGHKLRLEQP